MTRPAKPQAHYRPILLSALHHVLVKRDVWFFGIFALFLGSGSAIETVLRAKNGLENFDAPFLYRLFPFFEPIRQWTDQLSALPSVRAYATAVVLLVLVLSLLFLSVISQGAIIRETKAERKRVTMRDLARHARKRFWPIVGIDLALKAALAVCVLILLAPPMSMIPFLSDILLIIQWLIGYGLMFVASVVAVYALVSIVNREEGFQDALKEAWGIFSTHPGASLEMALILFFLNLLLGIGVLAFLLLLSVPYTFLFLAGAAGGSLLATTMATTITFLVAIALLVVTGGTATAYNYTVLALFCEKLRSGRFRAKWHRIRSTGHWF